ncbi:hypothetical protein E3N88_23176 [Mikania micrantha]|uniref:Uncharacterized protein n=1 Tax=Mikania micrantha TaxID=192012 RepID=A0A5N6NF61_9ASTR|nr:hypothetical protein E3N88_23176 [Mikania micrantha]
MFDQSPPLQLPVLHLLAGTAATFGSAASSFLQSNDEQIAEILNNNLRSKHTVKPTSFMLLRRTIPATVRHHSSATKNRKPLYKIPHKYRAKAIQQAQEALTDYLHTVKTIPYTFADNISKYSIVSLSSFISKVKFSAPDFSKSLQKFFRYHPVNEFELFFESIGIDVNEFDLILPTCKFFLSEDRNVFNVACALYGFGVPWNKLGILYKEEKTIFDKDPNELKEIWRKYLGYGFSSSSLIGICLVFPHVLNGDSEVEALINGLKRVVIDFCLINDVDGDVDTWIDLCRKIRLFYNLGCKKHDVFDMIGRRKTILLEYSEVVLSEKIKYFCRFDVTTNEVLSLLLSEFKMYDLDLRTQVFCVRGLLRHFGIDEKQLNFITEKYPYVFGRNRLANLPHVMRSLNLNQWFFDNLKHGGHLLLKSYPTINSDQDYDKDFAESLVRIQSSRGKKKIHFVSVKPGAKVVQVERGRRFKPVRGFGNSGSTVRVSSTVPKQQWVLKIRISTVKISPVDYLLNLESVNIPRCISGSGGMCKPVETEDGSVIVVDQPEDSLKGIRVETISVSGWIFRYEGKINMVWVIEFGVVRQFWDDNMVWVIQFLPSMVAASVTFLSDSFLTNRSESQTF